EEQLFFPARRSSPSPASWQRPIRQPSACSEPPSRGPILSVRCASMLYAFGSVIAASRMRPMVANCSAVHGLESEWVRVVKRSRKELGDGVLTGAFCAQQFNTKNAATIGEAKKRISIDCFR